jgi:hypothetical protein
MLIRLLSSSLAVSACVAAPVLGQDRAVLVMGGGSTFAAPL